MDLIFLLKVFFLSSWINNTFEYSKILGSKKIYRFSVRLKGIDAPEIKGKTQEEKNAAITSRNALREKIHGEIVLLKDVKKEKYGRLLANIYFNNTNVNEWMLTNNYAIPYDGGKKTDFEDFHKKLKNWYFL